MKRVRRDIDFYRRLLMTYPTIKEAAEASNVPERTLRYAKDKIFGSSSYKSRMLVISDTHEPFTHPDYMRFVQRVSKKYDCNKFTHIGDEVDDNGISYHESDPDGMSAGDEGQLAEERLHKWYEAFPILNICIGNHTKLPFRKGLTAGLPKRYLAKGYNEIWNIPDTWVWAESFIVDGVVYKHKPSKGGMNGPINGAINDMISTVTGHLHSRAGVWYKASPNQRIFAMSVGCGIHIKSYAMEYAKDFSDRPILGCGVVLDGRVAFFEPMEL